MNTMFFFSGKGHKYSINKVLFAQLSIHLHRHGNMTTAMMGCRPSKNVIQRNQDIYAEEDK